MNLKKLNYFMFDLDGTLLDSEKHINKDTLKTILELKKKGKKFALNTGRTPLISMQYMNQIEPDFPCSFCNGAIIYDFKNKKMIAKTTIGLEDATKAFNVLLKERSTILIYTTNSIYYKKFTENSVWVNNIHKQNNALGDFKANVAEITDDFNLADHEIYKIICISDEVQGSIENIRKELNTLKQCYPLQSNGSILDIIPFNTSKGTGLQYLFDNGYLDSEQTCVFGDEKNDEPMFEVSKYSVCMGQARDVIKQKATWVTDTNDNNGIGQFLLKTV